MLLRLGRRRRRAQPRLRVGGLLEGVAEAEAEAKAAEAQLLHQAQHAPLQVKAQVKAPHHCPAVQLPQNAAVHWQAQAAASEEHGVAAPAAAGAGAQLRPQAAT